MLLFLFVGVFLFRFVACSLFALLFHDPPRITSIDRPRHDPATWAGPHSFKPLT